MGDEPAPEFSPPDRPRHTNPWVTQLHTPYGSAFGLRHQRQPSPLPRELSGVRSNANDHRQVPALAHSPLVQLHERELGRQTRPPKHKDRKRLIPLHIQPDPP